MASQHKIQIVVQGDAKSAERMFDGLQKQTKELGKSFKDIGGVLTAGLSAPLVAIGGAALKMSTDLNAAMANVAALGVPIERVNELKTAVQDLAIETGKSTEDLSELAYNVISAFGDTADTVKIMEINAKAAAAGLAESSDALALTSAVTKGYNDMTAEAVQKAADLALTAVKLGQTTFPELASSIGKVVPLSNELGVSQEELFAIFATGTGVTGNAAEVATQYRGILQSIMAPTADTTKLIKSMGFESGKAMLKELGLQKSIAALTKAAEKSGKPLQAYISSIEGQTLALALSDSLSEAYTEKLEEMMNASGSMAAAFEAQTQGINAQGFSMQQLRSITQVLMQRLGDGLAPALGAVLRIVLPLADRALNLATAFANADRRTQTWIVGIAGAAAAAGPLLVAVGGLISGFSTLLPVLAALTGPVGLVVAGIAALIALDVGGIRSGLVAAFNEAKTAFEGAGGGADGLVAAIETLTGMDVSGALSTMAMWGDLAGAAFQSAYTGLVQLRDKIAEQIDIPAITDKIKLAFGAAVTFDLTTIDLGNLKDSVVTAIQNVDWADLADKGATLFSALKTGIVSALGQVDWSLTQFARGGGTTGGLVAAIGKMRDGVVDAIMSVEWGAIAADKLGQLQTAITGLKDAAIGAILTVSWAPTPEQMSSLSGLLDGAKPVVDSIFGETGILRTISASINEVIDAMSTRLAGVDANALGSQFSAGAVGVIGLIGLFAEAKTEGVSERISAVMGLSNSILEFLTGFAEGIDAEGIATAIGTFVGSITDTLASKLADPELVDLGTNIGAFVSTIITQIGNALGGGLGESLGGATGTAASALATGAMRIVTGIANELAAVDMATFQSQLNTFVGGFMTGLASEISDGEHNWQPVVNAMITAIVNAMRNFTWNIGGEDVGEVESRRFGGTGTEIPPFPGWDSMIKWPEIKAPDWSTLLFWPAIPAPDWFSILFWPVIPAPVWSSLIVFPDIAWPGWKEFIKWPSISWPGWNNFIKWPSIPRFPGWRELFSAAVGSPGAAEVQRYGGTPPPNNASGTPFWRGGLSWVGEEGPELVRLPRGSQVWPHNRSMGMAAEGIGGGVVMNNTFVVNNDIDAQSIAHRMVREIARRKP